MPTILFSAPYMLPFVERFRPILERHGVELILADVHERLEEADILKYAGQFDGTICGDDRYTPRALEACAPRLKIISKWGTGVDSIDAEACERRAHPECFHPACGGYRHGVYAGFRPPPTLDGSGRKKWRMGENPRQSPA